MLNRRFRFDQYGTNLKTEIYAGIATFMAMSYIIFVNPTIISAAGIDFGSALTATCISASLSTILLGLFANYPFALAPGMGENVFFAFTICIALKIPWQIALGCVFIEGLLFIILTLIKVRQALMEAIPDCIKYGTACGIGLLITLIGLKEGGLVISDSNTFVSLGSLSSYPAIVTIVGVLAISILLIRRVRGAILLGILITSLIGLGLGVVRFQGIISKPPSMLPTFMKMDVLGALRSGLFGVIFIFLFLDMFDTIGTLAGVGQVGGFMKNSRLPRGNRCLLSDAAGTIIGSVCGTPTVTTYVESAVGISEGGRTGMTSLVTGGLFFGALFFTPLIKMIAGGYPLNDTTVIHPVTAPALIIVGCLMLKSVTRIQWEDYANSLPAFFTMVFIPFTFSISNGLAIGFISFALIKFLTGRYKEVSWLVYLVALMFIIRFIFIRSM